MFKESAVRKEEVSGLSHFCLSLVLNRWEDGGCLWGYFRKTIYGASPNPGNFTFLQPFVVNSHLNCVEQPTGEPHLLPTPQTRWKTVWSIIRGHMPELIFQWKSLHNIYIMRLLMNPPKKQYFAFQKNTSSVFSLFWWISTVSKRVNESQSKYENIWKYDDKWGEVSSSWTKKSSLAAYVTVQWHSVSARRVLGFMRLTGRTVGKRKREGRKMAVSCAIIKFDPSLRTAYCCKRDTLLGGFTGRNMGLHFQMKEGC